MKRQAIKQQLRNFWTRALKYANNRIAGINVNKKFRLNQSLLRGNYQ